MTVRALNRKRIDPTTQDFFQNQLKSENYAGAKDVLMMREAKPITAYRKEFLRGKRGKVDGKRAAVFLEAVQLRNAEAHVLEYFLALGSYGYKGSIVTHELNASMCSEIVSCKCKERSFRGAVASLVKQGWLSKTLIPTGRLVPTGFDAEGNETAYKLLKVCKISLTPAAKLLIAKGPVCDTSLPRQKMPLAPTTKQIQENSLSSLGSCDFENLHSINTSHARQGTPENKVKSTSETPLASHVKQNHSGEARQSARKIRKDCVSRLGRKTRNRARRTWASNRASFLADLFRIAKNSELHRIAALQTDLAYPPLLPTALEYEPLIFSWHEHSQREARRIIERVVLPELRAFCENLIPPAPPHPSVSELTRRRLEKQRAAHNRLRTAYTGFSKSLVSENMPPYVLEKILENKWTLDQIPWMVTSGKFKLKDCRSEELNVFREMADLLGQD